MATHDSSVPVDNEKAYANQGAAGPTKKQKSLELVFRLLTVVFTLLAFVVMITNIQSKRLFPTYKLWAKYYYSDAFMWFVVANGIAFVYTLISLFVSVVNQSPKVARIIVLLDLLVAYIIISGASAATAIAYIGKNGLSQSEWLPICNTFHRYCAHVLGALVASFLGWLNLTYVVIMGLHRK
jgi:uncharacterized protein (TIGR01569 family)